MAIIIDVKPSGIESGYEERPFDVAKAELEQNGYDIISLKQFAESRIAQGKDSHVANYRAYVREGFLYVPQRGIFLVRNSPILANAREATQAHRNNTEFYLTPSQIEEALGKNGVDSIQFKDARDIPVETFGEDERTVFAFGDSAQAYGDFLKQARITAMPIYLVNIGEKPFARQAWLLGLGNQSGLGGSRNLDYNLAVRGVRYTSAEGASVARNLYSAETFIQACARQGLIIQGDLEVRIRGDLK
jgi:hypothetical protein